MNENVRRFYMSFHKRFQGRDPNVNSVLVDDSGVNSKSNALRVSSTNLQPSFDALVS